MTSLDEQFRENLLKVAFSREKKYSFFLVSFKNKINFREIQNVIDLNLAFIFCYK